MEDRQRAEFLNGLIILRICKCQRQRDSTPQSTTQPHWHEVISHLFAAFCIYYCYLNMWLISQIEQLHTRLNMWMLLFGCLHFTPQSNQKPVPIKNLSPQVPHRLAICDTTQHFSPEKTTFWFSILIRQVYNLFQRHVEQFPFWGVWGWVQSPFGATSKLTD